MPGEPHVTPSFIPVLPPALAARVLRDALAASLQVASRLLGALAQRLAEPAPGSAVAALPQLEFHSEAGAPEGALYADGVLVALLPGVTRL